MTVIVINSLAEYKEHLQQYETVIIDCWATWCGPCRMISPIFEKLAEEYGKDNVCFAKLDVDACPDVAEELGIRAMPTFVAFKNGERIDDVLGANPPAVQKLIQKATQ